MQTSSRATPDCRGESDGADRRARTNHGPGRMCMRHASDRCHRWGNAAPPLHIKTICGPYGKEAIPAPSRIVQHTPPTVEVIRCIPGGRAQAWLPILALTRFDMWPTRMWPPPIPVPQRIAPPEDKDQPTPVRVVAEAGFPADTERPVAIAIVTWPSAKDRQTDLRLPMDTRTATSLAARPPNAGSNGPAIQLECAWNQTRRRTAAGKGSMEHGTKA